VIYVDKKLINPENIARPIKPTYSHGVKVKAGTFLFLAGQVAFDKDGNIVGKGDAAAQTRQLLENMRSVLEEAGATFNNIVNVKVYLKDLKDFEAVHKVRLEYFSKEPPSSTLVEVKSLVHPELLVEIDAVAALD